MGNVVECENEALVRLYRLYAEVVAWATFFGLIFPLIFLQSNQKEIPQASILSLVAFILVVLCFLLYTVSTGEIFPRKLTPKRIRKILYGWGLALLGLTTWLVYCTGGIQSSIFVWLFEYAFIIALIVRPKEHKQAFFKQWRPVLVVVGFEILFIVILVFLGRYAIQIPDTIDELMPIWGGFSVSSCLILSFFLFYVYPGRIKKIEEGIKNV